MTHWALGARTALAAVFLAVSTAALGQAAQPATTAPSAVTAGVDKIKPLGTDASKGAREAAAGGEQAAIEADAFKIERDRPPLPRDFVQQPPLIPHTTRGYAITMNFNKCMDCHAWSRARETGATKVSLTHFRDRDGKELSNVSPRRYFCLQCHVSQTDAKPLVENTFKPAVGLR
jgi:cytochrome c-type protein NapB